MTTLWGKDISGFQSGPADGPDFCWVKQSEGTYNADAGAGRLRGNVPWVGSYHYLRPGRTSPEAEARWIVEHHPANRDGICLDIEAGMGEAPYPTPLLSGSQIDDYSARVAQLVHDALGMPVVIYCARSYGAILRKTLALPYTRLWLATLNPNFGSTWNGLNVWFNQYVWTPLDGDLFNGDLATLRREISKGDVLPGPAPAVVPTPPAHPLPQYPALPGVKLGELSLTQWNSMVSRGDTTFHPVVRCIQHVLNMFGDGPLVEDGCIGPSTRMALKHFQAQTGLPSQTESLLTIQQWIVMSTRSNRFIGRR